MTNKEIKKMAQDIVGKWGYEEEYWWKPIYEAMLQIQEQTLKKAIAKIKERGLHLGYANNIIDELQALKDKGK